MGTRRGRETTYGQRGGVGPTAGRKSETLIDPVSGLKKRVFFGQRWLCVIQDDQYSKPHISAWHSEEEAEIHLRNVTRFMESRGEIAEFVGRVAGATVA